MGGRRFEQVRGGNQCLAERDAAIVVWHPAVAENPQAALLQVPMHGTEQGAVLEYAAGQCDRLQT